MAANSKKRSAASGEDAANKRAHSEALAPGDVGYDALASTEPMNVNSTLYVNNLNDKIGAEDLKVSLYMLFSVYGRVLAINAHRSESMRGQAHVAFGNSANAGAALRDLQGRQFLGRAMRISYARKSSDRVQRAQT